VNDVSPNPLGHSLDNFVLQIAIFRLFVDAIVTAWSKVRATLSASYIAALQRQLNDAIPNLLGQDGQTMDLHINQQWLKSTVWQLGRKSNDPTPFHYSMDLSRELLASMASQFPSPGFDLLSSRLVRFF
jgi:hypothetical protein